MNKRVAILLMTGLLSTSFAVGSVWAEGENGQKSGAAQTVQVEKKENHMAPPWRMRKPLTDQEKEKILWEKYEIPATRALVLIHSGTNFRDIDKAGLYAYVADRPIEDVLALKKDESWTRVEYLLHITPQAYHDRHLMQRAHLLSKWWGIDEGKALSAMQKGYAMHHVKAAWVLSKHSDLTMEEILRDRKYSETWPEYAKRLLGVDKETYDRWIGEYPNPIYFPGRYF